MIILPGYKKKGDVLCLYFSQEIRLTRFFKNHRNPKLLPSKPTLVQNIHSLMYVQFLDKNTTSALIQVLFCNHESLIS